jgi:hypothetical protein
MNTSAFDFINPPGLYDPPVEVEATAALRA